MTDSSDKSSSRGRDAGGFLRQFKLRVLRLWRGQGEKGDAGDLSIHGGKKRRLNGS